jgi:hypothetical protein
VQRVGKVSSGRQFGAPSGGPQALGAQKQRVAGNQLVVRICRYEGLSGDQAETVGPVRGVLGIRSSSMTAAA